MPIEPSPKKLFKTGECVKFSFKGEGASSKGVEEFLEVGRLETPNKLYKESFRRTNIFYPLIRTRPLLWSPR